MLKPLESQLAIIKRGMAELISEKELIEKLSKGKKLRVKLGVDPTSADIHLGHTVVLQKLRQFQDLGHQAVLIIGDYTALVGDPSGTQKTRPQLNEVDIKRNAKTYFNQVQKVLNMKSLEIRYNGEWFKKMKFVDVIKLCSRMTVARMLERDDFSKRFKGGIPICIHEFIYPLMQGYDSLRVKADIELGGTDQLFNLLVGRALQKEEGDPPQVILTTPLIEGTDGVQKMSKSLENFIGVTDEPSDMFGKVMSISDELMWKYYNVLSQTSGEEIDNKKGACTEGKMNPRDAKRDLALEIVERFHSRADAKHAEEAFTRLFKAKDVPQEMEVLKLKISAPDIFIGELIVMAGLAGSNSQARRLIEQGAVSINGEKQADFQKKIGANGELILKIGKRHFKKIKFLKVLHPKT